MKEKNERGEKTRVQKKRKGGKKDRKKIKFHSRARTRDLQLYSQLPTATAWGRIARMNVLNRHISRISIVMN